MKKIGITGGVGAGKSIILEYLPKLCSCKISQADQIAWRLEEKDGPCYLPLLDLLGDQILAEDGSIDRKKMSSLIFPDEDLVKAVNAIVHPAVLDEIKREIKEAARAGNDYYFLEAALLIEGKCDTVMDEVWYVYAPKKERLRRLKHDRGYTEAKALSIMKRQMTEKEFRSHADRVIRNDRDPAFVERQLRKWLT